MTIKNLLILMLVGLTSSMQSQSYNFSVSSGTYSDIEGSVSLNNGITWDDPQYLIPIGFNFLYFDSTIDKIYISEWGYGGELTTEESDTGIQALLIPYGADIIDRGYDFANEYEYTPNSLSNISYLLEGEKGSQVLKIEWKNVGFFDELDEDNVSNDFTNFQLWLYEETNDIEIHFGPNSITQPYLSFEGYTGSYVGLFPLYDFDEDTVLEDGIVLSGNPSAPNVILTNSIYEHYLNGVIPNGTIYKFTNNIVGISEYLNNSIQLSIHPNPTVEYFKISFDSYTRIVNKISILNLNGQNIRNVNRSNNTIDISYLNSGVYFVEIETAVGIVTKRLLKK